MSTETTTNRAINAEFLCELDGVPSHYGNNAYKHRYTVKSRYDSDAEPIVFEATNEQGTAGALLFYYYIQYFGALEDMNKESKNLVANAERSVERIARYGGDTQLWVLSQTIDRINAKQLDAQKYLEMCYIYVDIVTGKVRA